MIMGIIYSLNSEKFYLSKSHIALFRLKLESPDSYGEESRNRWIWIRDGLNIKSAIITDEMLLNTIKTNSAAQKKSKLYPDQQSMLTYLKTLINIQFTGADENNFLIEVKAPSPTLALDLNNNIHERIKYLATELDKANFDEIINELKKKQFELKKDQEIYNFYQDKIKKMIFAHTVEQKQREISFQTISKPQLELTPIWPNHKIIIATFSLIGIFIGLSLEFYLNRYQEKNETKLS